MKRHSNVRQLSTIYQIFILFILLVPAIYLCVPSVPPSICVSQSLCLCVSPSQSPCALPVPCLVLPPASTHWYWIDLTGRGVQDIISCSVQPHRLSLATKPLAPGRSSVCMAGKTAGLNYRAGSGAVPIQVSAITTLGERQFRSYQPPFGLRYVASCPT